MHLFKRNRAKEPRPGLKCPHCSSTDTVVVSHGEDSADHIRTWRGQRYVVCRCRNCGREFYAGEPPEGADAFATDDRIVEDEEALRAAEEELRRQADEENDRRYKP